MAINRRHLLFGGSAMVAARAFAPTPTAAAEGPPPTASQPAPLNAQNLARFVDRLPIPPLCRPAGRRADPQDRNRSVAYYRLSMRQIEQRLHRDLPPTRMWSYGGSVPGPTIEARGGEPLLVEWVNDLPASHFLPIDHTVHGAEATLPKVRTVTHVHGARVPPESDGYPEDWFTRSHSALYRYPNQQDAALLWYHDHAMGLERLNQYAGLFGLFIVRDEQEDSLALPRGAFEIPLVICDRQLGADGQLYYPRSLDPERPWVPEVYGDAFLVNGKLFPFAEVEPRIYRLRVVNASNSRFLNLALSTGRPFYVIGADQGLLPAPEEVPFLSLAPAERADLLVDFSASAEVRLLSQTFELVQFRVRTGAAPAGERSPPALRPVERIAEASAVLTRVLSLGEQMEPKSGRMLMLLNGAHWHEPVTENPVLNSVEIWSLVNLTEDIHPIHLHMVRFQLLDRQYFDIGLYQRSGALRTFGAVLAPLAHERGWKDTVQAQPGMVTRIIIRFAGFAGRYVWHCHVLEHAAHEMMRPFEIIPVAGSRARAAHHSAAVTARKSQPR